MQASRNKILIVDDEPLVLRLVSASIGGVYGVLVAENGSAGFAAFQSNREEIVLVLTDLKMPIMGGLEMAEKILNDFPDTRILLMTAYSEEAIKPINERRLPLIRKPFLGDELLRKIGDLLEDAASA